MDAQLTNNLKELENMFGSRMLDYEEKLKKCHAETHSSHPDLSSLSREFSEFKCFIWQTLSRLKTQIELLCLGLDRHETAMRHKVLLFHGIPEKVNENLHDVLHSVISNQLKLTDLSKDSLKVCHRLGSAQGKTRPVLVRFFETEHRQLVWDSKTNLKSSGITISEFLTKTRHRVFSAARKHFGIKHCWSSNGKIVIILPDKSRLKIETMTELEQLTVKYPCIIADSNKTSRSQETSSPKGTSSKNCENVPKKTRRR